MGNLFLLFLTIATGFGVYKYTDATFSPAECHDAPCNLVCQLEQVVDSSGCKVCGCQDPCQDVDCPSNSTCRPVKHGDSEDGEYVGQCTDKECPDLSCKANCTNGHTLDLEGCPTCTCIEPCHSKVCPAGELCKATKIGSKSNFEVQCVKSNTVEEPEPECQVEACNIVCQFEQAVDSSGCKVCGCQDPCQDVDCPSNSTCRPVKYGDSEDGEYVGQCTDRECPDLSCKANCTNGHTLDLEGCPTCTCIEPCHSKVCSAGELCKATKIGSKSDFEVQCVKSNTVEEPEPECFEKSCNMSCEFGQAKDNNNCLVCSCADDPCNVKTCDKGHKCVPEKTEDDYYFGNCTVCPHISCDNICPFGYLRPNGCDSCDCARDPCSNTSCPQGNKCTTNSENLPECVSVENHCLELECRLECLGFVEFNRNKLNCTSCRCDNPCLNATCKDNMCYMEQKVYSEAGKEIKVTLGSCREDQKCPPLSCNKTCNLKKDKFGCPLCQCASACDQINCGKNGICKSVQIFTGDPLSKLFLQKEAAECHVCPTLKCSKPCLFGFRNCESCQCADNPCDDDTLNPWKTCQALFFPTYAETTELFTPRANIYQDFIYLNEGEPRCDQLRQRYLEYFNLSYPLNCDSENNFKPLQCFADMCWCLNKTGHQLGSLEAEDLQSITCGYYSKEYFQLLAMKDMSEIPEDINWRLKIEFSKQLAELLKVKEDQVILTSIEEPKRKGFKLKYLVLASTEYEAMQIKNLAPTILNLTLQEQPFGFQSIDPAITSSPNSPTNPSTSPSTNLSIVSSIDPSVTKSSSPSTSPSTRSSTNPLINIPTDSSTNHESRSTSSSAGESEDVTRLLLLTILLPILVTLCVFTVAFIIGFCVIKRLKSKHISTTGSLYKEPIVFPENSKLDYPYLRSTSLSEA